MNLNSQPGLSWHEWVADPGNKKLFEWNQIEARKKFLRDENDYIEQIVLHERRIQESQQDVTSIANMALTSGVGGTAASGGGGYNINTGIGNFSIGTYLNSALEHILIAVDEGFTRFTVA